MIALPRTELKAKVVDAPEVLTVVDSIPDMGPFLNSLYYCRYREFFQVCMAYWDKPLVFDNRGNFANLVKRYLRFYAKQLCTCDCVPVHEAHRAHSLCR